MLLALAAAVATSITPAAEPTPAAMAMAQQLHPTPPFWFGGMSTVDAIAKRETYALIHTITPRGVGCDPAIDACREAAERIAHEEAVTIAAARQKAAEKILAVMLDNKIDAKNFTQVSAFAMTPESQELASALMVYADPTLTPDVSKRVLAYLDEAMPQNIEKISDRFFDETKALPRDHPIIPPPPAQSRSNEK